jgi:HEPN/Toprim N-terminal domain 1
MGSCSTIYVGNFEIDSDKNDVNQFFLSIFQESDKKITKVTRENKELFSKYYDIDGLEKDEILSFELIQLVCPVGVVLDRLDLLGFTKEVAEKGFEEGVKVELEKIIEQKEYYLSKYPSEELHKNYLEKFDVLNSLNFVKWKQSLLEVMELKRLGVSRYDSDFDNYPPLIKYMLDEQWFGIPEGNYSEYRHFLRILLEAFDEDDELIYDLTDLALGGWVNIENILDYSDDDISPIHDISRRIIVITEGSTDSLILERSLKLLYPHLASFFRFLDFKGTNIAGGASALAHTVKAFAGVGIVNRIIALFDNDTGAEDALRTLNGIALPRNIEVLRYPEIELAKNYSTIGPTGIAKMDVNGLAGSIELYLGIDVLTGEDGNQIPIQWKGYVQSLRKYQGEIISKSDVQNKFLEKLKLCEKNPSLIENFDWTGIKAIINSMLTAFHKKDEEEILKIISEPVKSNSD